MTQSWLEWTPTWGLSLRFPDLELRYGGRVNNGMGRTNGQQFFFPPGVRAFDVGLPGFFVTSNGPVAVSAAHTGAHQISLSPPLPSGGHPAATSPSVPRRRSPPPGP